MAGTRSRLSRLFVLAGLALLSGCRTMSDKSLTVPQPSYLQHPPQYMPPKETVRAQSPTAPARQAIDASTLVCKVYPLGDLGIDPKLCKWIAATIPQMIQPDSWHNNGGKLSYHAPTRVLVINHTPAVHQQVAGFLDSLKQAATQAKHTPVNVPESLPSSTMPKHLFHFIIRYEGDGYIDGNAVKVAEDQNAPVLVNQYSSDPITRMEESMIDSENLRQMHDEWRRFWTNDQPAQLTPYRISPSVEPPPEKTSVPRMAPAD